MNDLYLNSLVNRFGFTKKHIEDIYKKCEYDIEQTEKALSLELLFSERASKFYINNIVRKKK